MILEERYSVLVIPNGPNELTLTIGEHSYHLKVALKGDHISVEEDLQLRTAWVRRNAELLTFYTPCGPLTVHRSQSSSEVHTPSNPNHQLTAPMPATVVAVLKNKGDHIVQGDPLMVLEAMKMEHTIHAPRDGEIQAVFYDIGAQVHEGSLLLSLVGST